MCQQNPLTKDALPHVVQMQHSFALTLHLHLNENHGRAYPQSTCRSYVHVPGLRPRARVAASASGRYLVGCVSAHEGVGVLGLWAQLKGFRQRNLQTAHEAGVGDDFDGVRSQAVLLAGLPGVPGTPEVPQLHQQLCGCAHVPARDHKGPMSQQGTRQGYERERKAERRRKNMSGKKGRGEQKRNREMTRRDEERKREAETLRAEKRRGKGTRRGEGRTAE